MLGWDTDLGREGQGRVRVSQVSLLPALTQRWAQIMGQNPLTHQVTLGQSIPLSETQFLWL